MKVFRYMILLSVVLLFASCKSQKKETVEIVPLSLRTTAQTDDLIGQVKRVVEKKFLRVGETDSMPLYATHYKTYSKAGWLLEELVVNDANDTVFITKVQYDQKGHMSRSETFGADGKMMEHSDFTVDEHGYRIKEVYYKGDSIFRQIDYKNDVYGNVLEMKVMSTKPTPSTILVKYTYDASMPGLPIRYDNIGPDGTMFIYTTFEYNERGQIINRRTFSASGAEAESSHSQYGEKGEILKESHQLSLKQKQGKQVSTYSDFDPKGNWKKQSTESNEKLQFVLERTIEYY